MPNNRKWTVFANKIIENNYKTMLDRDIVLELAKCGIKTTVGAVKKQRQLLGLNKSQGRHLEFLPQNIKKDGTNDSRPLE